LSMSVNHLNTISISLGWKLTCEFICEYDFNQFREKTDIWIHMWVWFQSVSGKNGHVYSHVSMISISLGWKRTCELICAYDFNHFRMKTDVLIHMWVWF
jgi:hypothetical protein